eukprot:g1165.t1
MGLTASHRDLLQTWVDAYNVILMFRISDLTTLKLIDTNRFASKAQNIHDKSSDWGPQRGTVPLDPYFNKKHGKKLPDPPSGMTTACHYGQYDKNKCTMSPTADIMILREDASAHAEASEREITEDQYKTYVRPTQLFLTDVLIEKYLGGTLTECAINTCVADQELCAEDGANCKCVRDENTALPENLRDQTFCLVKPEEDKWNVFWQDRVEDSRQLHALYVWSYNGSPVTGDYDLWMVAPHMRNEQFAEAGMTTLKDRWEYMTKLQNYPTRGNEKDGSLMTPLVHDLMYSANAKLNLNTYLGRQPGHEVLHHGVEMDNFFYLQPLDGSISMIVPTNQELPSYLRTGEVKQGNIGKVLAALQAHGYFVSTNPLFKRSDPRLEGKKVKEGQESEAETNIRAMREFMHDLYVQRGTDMWTDSTDNDLNANRMSADCVPPQTFDVPRMTFGDRTNARIATEEGTIPDLAWYEMAKSRMNVAEDEDEITVIPTVCQDKSSDTCGVTPDTVGICKWRADQCDVYSHWPRWGKVEFEMCTIKEDANADTVCGYEMFQWCRRVGPDVPALRLAEGKLKLTELQFSQWLVLTRSASAAFQQVLARHYIVADANAEEYRRENDGKTMPVARQLHQGLSVYNALRISVRAALCEEEHNAEAKKICNRKLGACYHIARLLNAGKDIPEDMFHPYVFLDNGDRRDAGSIRETCNAPVQKKLLEMHLLSPRGAFKEAFLWAKQVKLFKSLLGEDAGEQRSAAEDAKIRSARRLGLPQQLLRGGTNERRVMFTSKLLDDARSWTEETVDIRRAVRCALFEKAVHLDDMIKYLELLICRPDVCKRMENDGNTPRDVDSKALIKASLCSGSRRVCGGDPEAWAPAGCCKRHGDNAPGASDSVAKQNSARVLQAVIGWIEEVMVDAATNFRPLYDGHSSLSSDSTPAFIRGPDRDDDANRVLPSTLRESVVQSMRTASSRTTLACDIANATNGMADPSANLVLRTANWPPHARRGLGKEEEAEEDLVLLLHLRAGLTFANLSSFCRIARVTPFETVGVVQRTISQDGIMRLARGSRKHIRDTWEHLRSKARMVNTPFPKPQIFAQVARASDSLDGALTIKLVRVFSWLEQMCAESEVVCSVLTECLSLRSAAFPFDDDEDDDAHAASKVERVRFVDSVVNPRCVLGAMMICFVALPVRSQTSFRQLLLRLLSFQEFKQLFAFHLTRQYRDIGAQILSGALSTAQSLCGLSVQFLNRESFVMPMATMKECDYLRTLMDSVGAFVEMCTGTGTAKDARVFKVNSLAITQNRFAFCMNDLKYCFMIHKVSAFFAEKAEFIDAYLDLVARMQGMCPIVRMEHLREGRRIGLWPHAFTIELQIGQLNSFLLHWIGKDVRQLFAQSADSKSESDTERKNKIIVSLVDRIVEKLRRHCFAYQVGMSSSSTSSTTTTTTKDDDRDDEESNSSSSSSTTMTTSEVLNIHDANTTNLLTFASSVRSQHAAARRVRCRTTLTTNKIGALDFDVTKSTTSLHYPLQRLLGLLVLVSAADSVPATEASAERSSLKIVLRALRVAMSTTATNEKDRDDDRRAGGIGGLTGYLTRLGRKIWEQRTGANVASSSTAPEPTIAQCVFDPPLRCVVLAAQTRVGMWRRSSFLYEMDMQISNYERLGIMSRCDRTLLQCACVVMGASKFFDTVRSRFRLDDNALWEVEGRPKKLGMLRECLHFVYTLVTELPRSSTQFEDELARCMIHRLIASEGCTFSDLVKVVSSYGSTSSTFVALPRPHQSVLKDLVDRVALPSSKETGKQQRFILRDSMLSSVDIFFHKFNTNCRRMVRRKWSVPVDGSVPIVPKPPQGMLEACRDVLRARNFIVTVGAALRTVQPQVLEINWKNECAEIAEEKEEMEGTDEFLELSLALLTVQLHCTPWSVHEEKNIWLMDMLWDSKIPHALCALLVRHGRNATLSVAEQKRPIKRARMNGGGDVDDDDYDSYVVGSIRWILRQWTLRFPRREPLSSLVHATEHQLETAKVTRATDVSDVKFNRQKRAQAAAMALMASRAKMFLENVSDESGSDDDDDDVDAEEEEEEEEDDDDSQNSDSNRRNIASKLDEATRDDNDDDGESRAAERVECVICRERCHDDGDSENVAVFPGFVQLTSPKGTTHVRLCGHTMHARCFYTYFKSGRFRKIVRGKPLVFEAREFACPLCKAISNLAVPAVPTTRGDDVEATASVKKLLYAMGSAITHVQSGCPIASPAPARLDGHTLTLSLLMTIRDLTLEGSRVCDSSIFDTSHPFRSYIRRIQPFVRAANFVNSKHMRTSGSEALTREGTLAKLCLGLSGKSKRMQVVFKCFSTAEEANCLALVLRVNVLARTSNWFGRRRSSSGTSSSSLSRSASPSPPASLVSALSGFATNLCAVRLAVICRHVLNSTNPSTTESCLIRDVEAKSGLDLFADMLRESGMAATSRTLEDAWTLFRPFCREVANLLHLDPSASTMPKDDEDARTRRKWWECWPPETYFARRLTAFTKQILQDTEMRILWRVGLAATNVVDPCRAIASRSARELVRLPKSFVELYASTSSTPCSICEKRPGSQSVMCLLCGEVLCVGVCNQGTSGPPGPHSIGNMSQHVRKCGGSSGAFMFLRSGKVFIARGGFVAGPLFSLYLDEHGEEMRGLSHDFPLYLETSRYEAVRKLWAARDIPSKVTSIRSGSERVIIYNRY